MKRIYPVVLAAVVLLGVSCTANRTISGWNSEPLDDSRTLEQTIPADGVEIVLIDGNAGRCLVTANDGDRIVVSVDVGVSSGDQTDETDAYIAEASLEANTGGSQLTLRVAPGKYVDDVEEQWTVTIPARMMLEVDFDAANIDVSGARGGTSVEVATGDVKVEALGGNVDVDIEVGDAVVTAYDNDYGRIRVKSSVGDTELSVFGYEVDYDDAPGAGSKIAMNGEGEGRVDVSVNVGDAKLTILKAPKKTKEKP